MRGFTEVPLPPGASLWSCETCHALTVRPGDHLRWHRDQLAQHIETVRVLTLPGGTP